MTNYWLQTRQAKRRVELLVMDYNNGLVYAGKLLGELLYRMAERVAGDAAILADELTQECWMAAWQRVPLVSGAAYEDLSRVMLEKKKELTRRAE